MFSCEAWIDVFSMAAWIDVFSMAIVVGLMCSPVRPGLMCSPVRTGLISSPVEASYPCSLGLMGSTSHLINEQGNEVRDHSSTDGRIVVTTVLPTLG